MLSPPPSSPAPAPLSRVGRLAGPRVGARRPVVPHPSDNAIEVALSAYGDEVFRGFHHTRLTVEQRQRLRTVIAGVLAATGVTPRRGVIRAG